jgi:hypothetical protein
MNADVTSFMEGEVMRDVDALTVVLVSLLIDQIHTLARFYDRGMWREDPSELGAWLRRKAAVSKSADFSYSREEALREWQLWGRGTDVLIEVLERDTMIRVDRGRIVALAKRVAKPEPEDLVRREARHKRVYQLRKRRGDFTF